MELAADIDQFLVKCARLSSAHSGTAEWVSVIAHLLQSYGATQRLPSIEPNAVLAALSTTPQPASFTAENSVLALVTALLPKLLQTDGATTPASSSALSTKALPFESVHLDPSLLPASIQHSDK